MSTIYKRALAQRDLVDNYVYLAEHAGISLAEKFLSNAEASFIELAAQPNLGAPLSTLQPSLQGMRKWRVKNFDHFLIFYLPVKSGVSIVRVLHAARNWQKTLSVRVVEARMR